jgi:hypothetical protein
MLLLVDYSLRISPLGSIFFLVNLVFIFLAVETHYFLSVIALSSLVQVRPPGFAF